MLFQLAFSVQKKIQKSKSTKQKQYTFQISFALANFTSASSFLTTVFGLFYFILCFRL
jgi:ribulose 1,5-bisphosphate carboxylase large subunit-like protein